MKHPMIAGLAVLATSLTVQGAEPKTGPDTPAAEKTNPTGRGAFDTFACSSDLIHWTKWTGSDLVQSSVPWDKTFAHKPWLVKHEGVVYPFYCAVGDQGRVIALATSKDLRNKSN